MTAMTLPALSHFPRVFDTFVMCCAYAASIKLSAMHSPPSPGVERRQTPRTALPNFVYLNLDERHYGSVLNVSKTGLCFRSVVPVGKMGVVSFSLSEGQHQVQGTGEVVWTDQTQKTGGLRFAGLSAADARELFENFISPPTGAPPAAPLRLLPPVTLSQAKRGPAKVKSAFIDLFRGQGAVFQLKSPARLRTFSSGLITGVLVSGLVAGVLLFNSYRRQFGELLIHWGQRFTSQRQTQAAVPGAGSAEFPGNRTAQAESLSTQPAAVEKVKPKPDQTPSAKEPTRPAEAAIVVRPEQRRVETNSAVLPPSLPASPAAAPVLSPPTFESLNTLHPVDPRDKALLRPEVAPITEAANAVSISEMYCDVGSFKEAAQADDTINRLSQMGFPATTVQKGILWKNTYHVLVGPYESVQQFRSARKRLTQRGFQPKPFQKGSRSLTLLSNLMLNGVQVPDGQYIISWGSYLSEATVKFVRNYAVVATAEGKWMKRGSRYKRDTYLYRPDRDGSRTLVEIHFQGMSKALVFGDKE